MKSNKLEEIVELDGHPTSVSQSAQTQGVIAGQYPEVDMTGELPESLKPGAWRFEFEKEARCKDKDKNKK